MTLTHVRLFRSLSAALVVGLAACSGIYRQRGLSARIERPWTESDWKPSHGLAWALSRYGAATYEISSKRYRISFEAWTNGREEQALSIGPALLIPLPLIPWPSGIYRALTKRSADDVIPPELKVNISVQGRFEENPVQIDLSKVEISIDPSMAVQHTWRVQKWTSGLDYQMEPVQGMVDVDRGQRAYELSVSPISKDIRSIRIKLRDVWIAGEAVDLPPFVFEKGTGIGMYPAVI